ncbi:MAG TPA: ornithine cyclodeaminase family protein [Candidatus Limnocylindrales bacterium]|nr:ornithine cyclodeaminase family protein [Candidatus Limnocylindrales bacterium]
MSGRPVRILNGDDVRRLLPFDACIEVMERALRELADGEVEMPVRLVLNTRDGTGAVALMPASLARSNLLGYKAVTVFPGTDPRIEPTHQAAVAVLDPGTGRMLGLVDGTSITEIRTAAVSAVATRHLARADSTVLAVIGAGAQAAAHAEAIGQVRPLAEIRIWSRHGSRAADLAARLAANRSVSARVDAVSDVRDALAGADVVVTATSSHTPVVRREWLSPGTHVNAVGACIPVARELDSATVADARFIVDSRAAALREAGDLLLAIADGAVDEHHIAGELGDVLVGRVAGRARVDELTVFESLGLGVEDVAAAAHVFELAATDGIGSVVDL